MIISLRRETSSVIESLLIFYKSLLHSTNRLLQVMAFFSRPCIISCGCFLHPLRYFNNLLKLWALKHWNKLPNTVHRDKSTSLLKLDWGSKLFLQSYCDFFLISVPVRSWPGLQLIMRSYSLQCFASVSCSHAWSHAGHLSWLQKAKSSKTFVRFSPLSTA